MAEHTSLNLQQAARMIEWLDDQRRQDKRTITALEQNLGAQEQVIEALQKRLNALEAELDTHKRAFVQSDDSSEIIAEVAGEVRKMIDNQNARRLEAERELERRNENAREALGKEISSQKERLGQLEANQREVEPLKAARQRLESNLRALQQRVEEHHRLLEEPEKRFQFLEEQHRQEGRRLAEVENQLPELRKLLELIRPKITLLEDLSVRTERRLQEMYVAESERREEVQQFIAQQERIEQAREAQQAEWVNQFQDQTERMEGSLSQFAIWADTHREMRQLISEFERVSEGLERRINELAEIQRLSEERFRKEWNDWASAEQQRWKQFTLSTDEIWRNHDREFERFVQRINQLDTRFPPLIDSITNLWQLERKRARLYSEDYQQMIAEHDKEASSANARPNSNP
ncbi:MAG: hypothetical protein OXF83_07395 [Anaerolineaceae bacterium]|nr:hypothetical protein [Anaerolineaceae bacterium]MCY3936121.1 hypothetical protein [Chloroflexota bacterium]MCY4010158.1 hypothetical protein [Anaerolineaceae bacterium]MCY4105471.1 hypothetical protein [Chloroflexota bacterium]